MEQGRKPTGPIGLVQIDRIDTGLGKLRGAAFRTAAHEAQAGGVDEVHIRKHRAPFRELMPVVMAEPQPR